MSQVKHELSTWSDLVAVKAMLDVAIYFRVHDAFEGKHISQLDLLFHGSLCFLSSSKSPGSLLIHFGSRGNSINGHINKFLGSEEVHQLINIVEDIDKHII